MKKLSIIGCVCLLLPFVLLVSLGTAEESSPEFEQPVLITSAGQSAEVQIASVLAKRAGLAAVLSKAATDRNLENMKTVALVIGVSLKGLGAAGLDIDQEKKRVSELIETARDKGIPILCLHLGGDARRGKLSDQMIMSFLPSARMAIVVKTGNADGLFTKICQENTIPLIEVERTIDVLEPLKQAFFQEQNKHHRSCPHH